LGDKVFAVREAGIQTLKKLTREFGLEWAQEYIFPRLVSISKDKNYLYRLTTLFAARVGNYVCTCMIYLFVCFPFRLLWKI
jgi:hypothetical protein